MQGLVTIPAGEAVIARIACCACGYRPMGSDLPWNQFRDCPKCGKESTLAWRFFPVEKR